MHDRVFYRLNIVACLLLLLTLSISSSRASEELPLDGALTETLSANPSLAAIQAKAEALAEIPDQSDVLPDPHLSVNIVNLPLDSFSFTQEEMMLFQFGITQALPYLGKLALRSEAANFEAGDAEVDVAKKRLQFARDVRTVWWNLFYLDRPLEVITRNQTLLQQIISMAETRYQVGQRQQQEILLAQLELSKLHDSAIQVQNMREHEVVHQSVLLDRPVESNIQLPQKVTEELPALMRVETLQNRAESSRPILAAQQGRLNAARSCVDLAKKEYAPDFQLGAVYGLCAMVITPMAAAATIWARSCLA